MGLGVAVPIPGSSVTIDVATLLYFKGIKRKKILSQKNPDIDATVVIPARNEERRIKQCIEALFNQTKPPKKVIVIDDCSQDKTPEICRELDQKYLDLIYIRQRQRSGKANNLNYAIQLLLTHEKLLTPIVVCIDGDAVPQSDFIEQITKPFVSEEVAAVSGTATIMEPENLMGKLLAGTYRFMFRFYSWQKTAQGYRNAVNPICGGAVGYRTHILRKFPIPARCITEDTDYTWLLQENKYKILHNPKAMVKSEQAITLRGFFRQWFRWYSGAHQAWYIHGKNLLAARKLLFTTLAPACLDAWIYSVLLLGFPLISMWNPIQLLWLMAFDVGLTAVFLVLLDPRELKYLPMIWLMKFPLAIAWLTSGLKTLWERLSNKQHLWGRAWERPDHQVSKKNFLTKIIASLPLHTINNPTKNTVECQFYKYLKLQQLKSIPDQCLQCHSLIGCVEK